MTRPRVRAGQCLIEQLHQLVQNFDVGLGKRREQDRVPPVDIRALQRLIGGVAPGLGKHPPAASGQAGQVESVRAMPT